MSGGTKSTWPVHSGCSIVSARIGTGLAGGRGAKRSNSPGSPEQMRAINGRAIAALAAAHAGPRGALQRGRRVVTGRTAPRISPACHLLAAADEARRESMAAACWAPPRTGATRPSGSAAARPGCGARAAAGEPPGRGRGDRSGGDRALPPSPPGRRRTARRRRSRRPRARWCGRRRRSPFPSSRCRAARSDGAQPSERASSLDEEKP